MRGQVPTKVSDTPPAVHMFAASPPNPVLYDATPSERLLGVQYRSTDDMVATAVASLLENGFRSTAAYAHAPTK